MGSLQRGVEAAHTGLMWTGDCPTRTAPTAFPSQWRGPSQQAARQTLGGSRTPTSLAQGQSPSYLSPAQGRPGAKGSGSPTPWGWEGRLWPWSQCWPMTFRYLLGRRGILVLPHSWWPPPCTVNMSGTTSAHRH